MRILLAEDNPTNRVVALRMLERLGYQTDVVRNGIEAIAALECDHYDLVRGCLPEGSELTRSRQLLLGACFTMEYALESVALFNPSIVPANLGTQLAQPEREPTALKPSMPSQENASPQPTYFMVLCAIFEA